MVIDKTASREAPALTAPASRFANWRNCVSELSAPPAPAASHHASAAPLDPLFNPRSIALVGATERSVWSIAAVDNLKRFGYAGKIHMINPKGGVIFGQQAAPTRSEEHTSELQSLMRNSYAVFC